MPRDGGDDAYGDAAQTSRKGTRIIVIATSGQTSSSSPIEPQRRLRSPVVSLSSLADILADAVVVRRHPRPANTRIVPNDLRRLRDFVAERPTRCQM